MSKPKYDLSAYADLAPVDTSKVSVSSRVFEVSGIIAGFFDLPAKLDGYRQSLLVVADHITGELHEMTVPFSQSYDFPFLPEPGVELSARSILVPNEDGGVSKRYFFCKGAGNLHLLPEQPALPEQDFEAGNPVF